ncbi:MAG: hypothetical protein ACRDZN_09800 [Acidimicrobiales bacterium]
MALTEGRRKRLDDKFEEVLGADNAETIMELLPPVGWADVATKHDLDAQFGVVGARFESVNARFETLEARIAESEQRVLATMRDEFGSATRSLMIWGSGLMTAIASLAFAAGHLL